MAFCRRQWKGLDVVVWEIRSNLRLRLKSLLMGVLEVGEQIEISDWNR